MCVPSTRERVFLGLTIVGFVVPNVMVGIYLGRHGLTVGNYLGDWFGTLPASQITVDIGLCALAFLIWSKWEASRVGVERWWLVFPATFLVGLCMGIPLFLLLRERALQTRA